MSARTFSSRLASDREWAALNPSRRRRGLTRFRYHATVNGEERQ